MAVTTYPIFEKAKRQKSYPEFYCLFFFCLGTVPFVFAKNEIEKHPVFFWIGISCIVLSFLSLILFLILNCYRIDFKKGKFVGNIILGKNEIVVLNEVYSLKNIKKIHFQNDDFFIRYQRNKWFGPKISCGVGNVFFLETKEGQKMEYTFYQSHDNELVKALEMLEYYHQLKILSTENLHQIVK